MNTIMLKNINPLGASSNPENLVDVNGVLYFTATDGINGKELWKSDGTLIIDGAIVFTTRASGLVSYTLSATDSAAVNSGVWEGEIQILNDTPIMEEQTETFTVTIEDSY